ncbi:MAG: DUF5908 family protein [Flavisolibacter sp.]
MPLEIKELIIRVSVNQPGQQASSPQSTSSPQGNNKDEKESLINQCVEQVIDLLKNKKER